MKIKVNCSDPIDCVKCIHECPAKIFVLKPLGTKRMSSYAEKWEIVALFKEFCNGCMKCVTICPKKNIEVNF